MQLRVGRVTGNVVNLEFYFREDALGRDSYPVLESALEPTGVGRSAVQGIAGRPAGLDSR